MDRTEFVTTCRRLFRGTGWVVRREPMAHCPNLGAESPDGPEPAESTRDQSSACLTTLTGDDHTGFETLTSAYRDRFGTPSIRCVRDAGRWERTLAEGRHRVTNSPAREHSAAFVEIAEIAACRFADQVGGANPIRRARSWALDRGDE